MYPERYSRFIKGVSDNSGFGKTNAYNKDIFDEAFRELCILNLQKLPTTKLED